MQSVIVALEPTVSTAVSSPVVFIETEVDVVVWLEATAQAENLVIRTSRSVHDTRRHLFSSVVLQVVF